MANNSASMQNIKEANGNEENSQERKQFLMVKMQGRDYPNYLK